MKNENMNEYSLPFAAWELRLYLDTHPNDVEALREYRRICNMSGGRCNYACHTAEAQVSDAPPVNNGCGCGGQDSGLGGNYIGNRCGVGNYPARPRVARAENGGCGCGCGQNGTEGRNVWSWIDGPWPWEVEANGGDC